MADPVPALWSKARVTRHPDAQATVEGDGGAVQTMPQPPQLFGSVWVSTHCPPHNVQGAASPPSLAPVSATPVSFAPVSSVLPVAEAVDLLLQACEASPAAWSRSPRTSDSCARS
jgi:hypothetical protein